MLKAIIVDDERPAIRELQYLLVDYEEIEVIGVYTDPVKALKEIEENKPQIAFLDINMPQMNGIDLACAITDSHPDINIVFTTAYDNYAVEAFELHALDYLLKPIYKDRLEKTIQRIIKKNKKSSNSAGRRIIIKCFGTFQIGWEGEEPIKWRTEKTKELFAYLLTNKEKNVTKYQIIDAVWPDVDPEKAEHQLYNGIYYIRKTLKEYGIPKENVFLKGNYCLSLVNVHFDYAFINEYIHLGIRTLTLRVLQRLEEEYSGNYFEGYDWQWIESDRHLYSVHQYKVTFVLSEIYFNNCEYVKAERLIEKLRRINPYDEKPIVLLMKIMDLFSRKNDIVKMMNSFCKTLQDELDVHPSDELVNAYKQIINK